MTRDYFVQKSTKIGDMRRRENAKNEAHCGKIPIFVKKSSSNSSKLIFRTKIAILHQCVKGEFFAL